MRKGDERRQAILTAAERLFCAKGYEATSIQDILDVLHISKGGLYHHFASKEEILKTLCGQRAERAAAYTAALLDGTDGMARINAVLYGFMPLRKDETPFVRLLLPLIETSEGRSMAMVYQDALSESFLPLLRQEVATAREHGLVCPPVRNMESVVLLLTNRCWMDAVSLLLRMTREGQRCDAASLLPVLERYRRAIEVLLDAPYGSVDIIRLAEWDDTVQRLSR